MEGTNQRGSRLSTKVAGLVGWSMGESPLLMLQKFHIQPPVGWCEKPRKKLGINYQPQPVSRISEASTDLPMGKVWSTLDFLGYPSILVHQASKDESEQRWEQITEVPACHAVLHRQNQGRIQEKIHARWFNSWPFWDDVTQPPMTLTFIPRFFGWVRSRKLPTFDWKGHVFHSLTGPQKGG